MTDLDEAIRFNAAAPARWRVSGTARLQAVLLSFFPICWLPLVLASVGLIVIKTVDRAPPGTLLTVTYLSSGAIAALLALGCTIFGLRKTKLLSRGRLALARIEGIQQLADRYGDPMGFARLDLSITDETGNTWTSTVHSAAGVQSLEPGSWVKVIYDSEAPQRAILADRAEDNYEYGKDGVIRPGNTRLIWGIVFGTLLVLGVWLFAVLWMPGTPTKQFG